MTKTKPKTDLFHEKKSRLSMSHTIKLADWVRKQNLVDVTYSQLAQLAVAGLGFRVTESNIRGALKATGLAITTSLDLAEQEAAQTKHNIATVAKIVAELLDELGHPVPDDLAAIAGIEG